MTYSLLLPVTAYAASSSLVVPAILFSKLEGVGFKTPTHNFPTPSLDGLPFESDSVDELFLSRDHFSDVKDSRWPSCRDRNLNVSFLIAIRNPCLTETAESTPIIAPDEDTPQSSRRREGKSCSMA
jgi:hypothetical protein